MSRSGSSRGARPARAVRSSARAGQADSEGVRRRDPVGEIQRARLLKGMAEVACERGIGSTTVAHVVERAGVSRRTFYDLFDDLQGCFLATFDEAVDRASGRVTVAYTGERRWVDGVRAGLFELLAFFDQEPQSARVCVVQALAGSPALLERRTQILRTLTAVVDEGAVSARARRVPPLAAEGVVGAVLAVVHARLLEREAPRLTELLGSLMGIVVLPYQGPAAAARELARPLPKPPERQHDHSEMMPGCLEDLGMRLTYRTLRVLAVIAQHGGISNRELAERAGITDLGQTSKLLARLQRLQLIHNGGAGHAKGATNAWTLTARGVAVQAALDVAPSDDQLPQR